MFEKRWIKILAFMIALTIISYTLNHWYRLPKYQNGELAQHFTATLANKQPFALEELKGQYVLLDFWGSWCGPCRRENPELVKLYKDFHGLKYNKVSDFEIVSIAVETKEDRWRKAIQEDSLFWTYHISEFQRFSGPIVTMYGIREIPTKYLLDPDGRILMVNPSFKSLREFLNQELASAE